MNRKQLVPVRMEGVNIWFEAGENVAGGRGPAKSVGIDTAEEVLDAGEKISETLRAFCASLSKTFKDMPLDHAPDKVTTEFGLSLGVEGNIFVVKATGEATLKIGVEWTLKGNC